MPFADVDCGVATTLQQLRQGDSHREVFSPRAAEVLPDIKTQWVFSCQDGGSRGGTDRRCRIESAHHPAFFGKSIDVGCRNTIVAEARGVEPPHVIAHHQQDVGTFRCSGGFGRMEAGDK